MWFLRRMLRISYLDRVTNEVLCRANSKRKLLTNIRKQQAKLFGHVMRKEGPEHLVTTGKVHGKRSRGRQRSNMINGMISRLEAEKATITIQRAIEIKMAGGT